MFFPRQAPDLNFGAFGSNLGPFWESPGINFHLLSALFSQMFFDRFFLPEGEGPATGRKQVRRGLERSQNENHTPLRARGTVADIERERQTSLPCGFFGFDWFHEGGFNYVEF